MSDKYNPHEIEARWRARWVAEGSGWVDLDAAARPFYNLVEFPYPSGEGLHIGHVFSYSGADAYGRYMRRRGYDVFQPIGFDSFGIHSENYALKVGAHPREVTARSIARFREQLRRLGAAFDWSREMITSDPEYYRWTQWIFVKLFKAGLAYRAEAPVNWCPSCRTVLANEQASDGRCERCDTPIVQRTLTQWFLRITRYADRLLDYRQVDFAAPVIKRQRAWIGRTEENGAVSYRLHDWLISRQRYWGPPIPIIYCDRCGTVPVPEDQLPVLLPHLEHYRPGGVAPLASDESFVSTTCPACGGPARRETDVSDNFLDSAWYFMRYTSTERADVPWVPGRVARWLPVHMYTGGPEHATMHHLYARFITMALHDLGLVPVAEPFARLQLHGMITRDGSKMSKSRGNVVNPDEYMDRYGADALRLAMLFMGPFDQDVDFSDRGVVGAARFLGRVWELCNGRRPADRPGARSSDMRPVGRAVRRVTEALEARSFNTAIAALMEFAGWLRAERARLSPEAYADACRTLVLLLAPFAPFVCEELWERLGGQGSVHDQPWPEAEEAPPETVELPVQVDGKVRGRVRVPADADDEAVRAAALAQPRVAAALAERTVRSVVVVPGRIVSVSSE
ncbi:MAG: leucine--tRNA ligase [Chloroflexota bacterium]|nr:MAG: leucine--tRNA ligase [Chloroflexota bacterium]